MTASLYQSGSSPSAAGAGTAASRAAVSLCIASVRLVRLVRFPGRAPAPLAFLERGVQDRERSALERIALARFEDAVAGSRAGRVEQSLPLAAPLERGQCERHGVAVRVHQNQQRVA